MEAAVGGWSGQTHWHCPRGSGWLLGRRPGAAWTCSVTGGPSTSLLEPLFPHLGSEDNNLVLFLQRWQEAGVGGLFVTLLALCLAPKKYDLRGIWVRAGLWSQTSRGWEVG